MGRIDQELTRQAEDVAKYWREVLTRLISVIAVSYTHLDVYKRQVLYNTMTLICMKIQCVQFTTKL